MGLKPWRKPGNCWKAQIKIKAIKQRLLPLKDNHKQNHESMITLAAAVKEAERIAKSSVM